VVDDFLSEGREGETEGRRNQNHGFVVNGGIVIEAGGEGGGEKMEWGSRTNPRMSSEECMGIAVRFRGFTQMGTDSSQM
jgi:hypothetical protein